MSARTCHELVVCQMRGLGCNDCPQHAPALVGLSGRGAHGGAAAFPFAPGTIEAPDVSPMREAVVSLLQGAALVAGVGALGLVVGLAMGAAGRLT